MNVVAAAFRNEARKIFWRAKYKAMLVVYALIGLGAGVTGASGYSLRAVVERSLSVAGPNVVFGALSAYRSFLIPLAVFMLCADVFTSELETKSIKCALTRPVSRFDIYLAKSLAILFYVAVSLGVGFAAAEIWQIAAAIKAGGAGGLGAVGGLGGAGAVGGVGGVSGITGAPRLQEAAGANALPSVWANALPSVWASAKTFLGAFAGQFVEALAAYALTLVPMAAYVAYASFVSVLIRSPALVMFLCIVTSLAMSFAGTFYHGAGAALFTTYTSWYRMWLGERLPLRSLAVTSGLLLSTCVAFFGFGYFIFEKKDI